MKQASPADVDWGDIAFIINWDPHQRTMKIAVARNDSPLEIIEIVDCPSEWASTYILFMGLRGICRQLKAGHSP